MSFSDDIDDHETFELDRLAEDDEGGLLDHEREPGRNEPDRIDPLRCACGLRYTEEEWLALQHVGEQQFPGDPVRLVLKNCLCGSTIAREMTEATREGVGR